ncbi:synaptotagmin-15 [Entelurus aequoreus]|uniref:synaptotagmin-15 n=1 Tax=Entelurus aequoreus TaxID=161455 RepID=UPI002B1DB898|nr:synaptotagmin-15 [Entelurus aequoreus]XP_061913209.1 synaptotagmin-15 [Entelurus aequoreus]XP_061913210.1 synaptotagmin-15 [Entelurus aequoreus]XP_061913212.1 synaptotagmin-15 [Entelurus aequoreus]
MVLVAAGLAAGLLVLLLLVLVMFYLWRRARDRSRYQELDAAVPPVPACTAQALLVSQGSWVKPVEIPFTLPPRFTTQTRSSPKTEEKVEEMKTDILAHRGSLSVQSWYPVGTLLAGLYSSPALSEVVAPPPGMATRLCFSVEYRHRGEQLAVSLLRLGNLPPRCHGNVTLVQLRLLPDDRRPRQAKARCTGPDPEFHDCFLFQVSGARVTRATLSVCVLSVSHDSKRQAVGRVLFPLQGELGQAGRVLWRDLEAEDHNHCSEWGDVLVSLSYSPSLQRLSVEVVRARGLQLVTDSGVCVQVTLQIHTQVVKSKRSSVVKADRDANLDHKMAFKLRAEHVDEACLRFVVQQPSHAHSEPWIPLGVLVLGPFMYARGPQLQHWMDMVNTAQEPVKVWHGLGRST